jgi:hypothetical protein
MKIIVFMFVVAAAAAAYTMRPRQTTVLPF